MKLNIDIISDVICPWCFVGKRKLERALKMLDCEVEALVRWHPFQLNPDMPREGTEREVYMIEKFGSAQASQAVFDRITKAGLPEGIEFAFDRIKRTPNTFDAHRLIWLAEREGVQDAVIEALFRAYFLEGLNVGDRSVLTAIAGASGIEKIAAQGFLDGEEGIREVRSDETRARQIGVGGVPFFIINQQYAVSGAQDPEILVSGFNLAMREDAKSA